MDKSTLSNYGWVVIAVLVISVMIALATPFGKYISTAVESTVNGLSDTMGATMSIDLGKLTVAGNSTKQEKITPLLFGVKYIVIEDKNNSINIEGLYYIFYEDGSFVVGYQDNVSERSEPCLLQYTETGFINLDGEEVTVTPDGMYSYSGGLTLKADIVIETHTPLQFEKKYLCLEHEEYAGAYLIFHEDGSAELVLGDETQEFPAGYFIYVETNIYEGKNVFATLSEDGKILTVNTEDGEVVAILQE